MPATYHPVLVWLSVSVAVLASYTALDLAARTGRFNEVASRVVMVCQALAMGIGIWSMHFIGMLAYQLPIEVSYDIAWTVASFVVSLAIAGFSARLLTGAVLTGRRLALSAAMLGSGISGMHYIGMAAMNMSMPIEYDPALVAGSVAVSFAASYAALRVAFALRLGRDAQPAEPAQAGHAARPGTRLRGARLLLARVFAATLMGIAMTGMHYTAMTAAHFDPAAICIGGIRINSLWFAVLLAIGAAFIVAMSLMLSVFDARMASRTGSFLRSLQQANARLERRVADRTADLADLYENAPCGYHSLGPDRMLTRMNQTELQWLGYTREEVIGRMRISDFVADRDTAWVEAAFNRFVDEGQVRNLELEFRRKNGTTFTVSINATAVFDADGNFVESRSTVDDITARKRAERELMRTSAFLDSVIEHIPTALHVKDATTRRYLHMNRACEAVFRRPRSELLGKTDYEIFDTHSAAERAARDADTLARNGPMDFRDDVVPLEDGTSMTIRSFKTTIPDENGRAAYLLEVAEDVTASLKITAELERKTREADEASRAKSAFLATMSHEIRTPMNGVIGMVEVLHESALSLEQLEMTQTVKDSASALLGIIDDILDFSKIEAGKFELECVPVSVAQVIESAGDSLASIADAGDVDLTLFCDPRLPAWVMSDPVRLRQILINLGGNAIKFVRSMADRRGHVVVRAELLEQTADHAAILFEISDNGIGMTGKTVEGLFRPFVQAENSTTRRYGGTGLGLSICQRIANAMGSRVQVESAEGAGSRFSVVLNLSLAPVASADAGEPQETGDLSRLRDVELLLFAPEVEFRNVLSRYLYGTPLRSTMFQSLADVSRRVETLARGRADFVIVLAPGQEQSSPSKALQDHLRSMAGSVGLRFLAIARGHKERTRMVSSDTVAIDANGMKRATLLRALAAASGRMRQDDLLTRTVVRTLPDVCMSPAEAEAAGRLILVAEDNPTNQKVIAHQLTLLGQTFEMTFNGTDALARLRTGRFGILLTDCHMPEMDGFEVTAEIRRGEHAGGPRLPIVAITANAMKGEADRCIRSGMDGYLTKPIQLEGLRATLEKWLPERPRPARRSAVTGHRRIDDDPVVKDEILVPEPLLVSEMRPSAGASGAVTLDVPAAVAPEPGMLHGAVRADALAEALGTDDPATMRDFYWDFIQSGTEYIGKPDSARSLHSARDIAMLAHTLKSSAGTIGAAALAQCCVELEQAGKSQTLGSDRRTLRRAS